MDLAALQAAHSPSCRTKLLATSTAILSPPLPAGLVAPVQSSRPVRASSFFPSLLSSWLPLFSRLALPSGPLAPWEADSTLGGSVTLKAALVFLPLVPISNLETSGSTTPWHGGCRRGLGLPSPPPRGAGRTVEFSKEPETPGGPSQGKKELPGGGAAPWQQPAPFAWEGARVGGAG